jgi:inositol transport system ATP-binding protein
MEIKKDNVVLELIDVQKSFSGVKVLKNVNIQIKKGSVHALVGENGAGKSTMMKIISGIYTPDSGQVIYKGEKLSHLTPEKSLDLGISMIHQELSPEPYMTIAENIFLGREPLKGKLSKMVDYKKMYADAQEIMDRMKLPFDVHKKMNELSLAAKQMIEIAKAISRNASIIIMDEPTSALTDDEVTILFAQIAELKKKEVAIVYITHKMDEIFALADDITVIRDGSVIDSASKDNFTMDSLITKMVGREIKDIYPKYEVPIRNIAAEFKGLTGKGFENISFSVRQGEILGIAGLVGAGRTEVARGIFGLDRLKQGEVWIDGEKLNIRNVEDAIGAGIAMVPEDRANIGLVLCRPIRENISLASLGKISSGGFLNLADEKKNTEEMVERLNIKIASAENPVVSLSGGNQQKVVLAKWILQNVKLLILDEPTRGIDVGSKSEIYRMMCEFAEQGMAIIMISSELPEILGMSDRVLVMHEGHISGELSREEATQESIMRYAVQ